MKIIDDGKPIWKGQVLDFDECCKIKVELESVADIESSDPPMIYVKCPGCGEVFGFDCRTDEEIEKSERRINKEVAYFWAGLLTIGIAVAVWLFFLK